MVSLTQGDKVFGEAELRVASATGEYADVDLIECVEDGNAQNKSAFQAQYIKYGPIVYQHNTPEELGAALFAVDPESTHDAAILYKEDEARRLARTKGTLEPGEPVAAPDAIEEKPVPEEEEPDTKFFKEQAAKDEAAKTASSTPEAELPEFPDEPEVEPELPAVEPPTLVPDNTSTTTPAVVEEPAIDVSTTTTE